MIDFIQYGALGIVAYVVYFLTQKFEKALNNNTEALVEIKTIMLQCNKKN